MTVELINPDTKVLYIAIPKTASSSISKSLAGNSAIGPEHTNLAECIPILKQYGVDHRDVFIIASIRHPFTRFLSWAYDVDNRPLRNFKIDWVKEGMSIDDLVKYVVEYTVLDSDGISFIHKDTLNGLGSHIQTQSSFIYDGMGQTRVNGLIRFENLEEDYKRIARKVKENTGLDVHPLAFQERKGAKTTLKFEERPELSKESKDLLYKLYKQDFVAFGYEYEM